MAGITSLTGDNVCRAFTRGNHTVVAAFAGADHLSVIHQACHPAYPRPHCMAGFTNIRRIDVAGRFCHGNDAIVAAGTGTEHLAMIDDAGIPCHTGAGRMAGLAHSRGMDVRCGCTGGPHTVMATVAGTHDLGVIDIACRSPAADDMTGLAQITGGKMIGSFALCLDTIVTSHAGLTAKQAVIHVRLGGKSKACGRMAGITGGRCLDMVNWLPLSQNVIVAALAAGRQYLGHGAHMTGLAIKQIMITIQWKTRHQMIEVLGNCGSRFSKCRKGNT